MLLLIYGHFMRQTPFSLLVLPSFAWRTKAREGGVGYGYASRNNMLVINFHVSLLKDGISRMVLRGADMDDVDF